ncbi:unnamed protein product [Fasciola hepatica]|uniref:Uncharacterized protein n=1 Tax=Fasciola hepatica TaxID=6192 RepID=A0ABC9HIT6_FASHE
MIVTGVSIERNISLWFTTYNYRQSPSLDGCVPEYFIEWFKTRHELHTCFHNVPKEIRKKIILLSPNDVTTNEMDYIGESIFKCQTKLVRGTRKYEWSEYHGNIVSCERGDSASEVDYNTEIITVNTKSLTMTVEDRSKQQNVTRESCSRGLTNKRNQMIPISIIGFLIAYH